MLTLKIYHMLPALLNLYGDRGNLSILAQRAHKRGIGLDIIPWTPQSVEEQNLRLNRADLLFLGGASDKEQLCALKELQPYKQELKVFIEQNGPVLAICGGMQMLGTSLVLSNKPVEGLGLLPCNSVAAPQESPLQNKIPNRIIGDVVLDCPLCKMPVIGYENHAGRTFFEDSAEGVTAFGRVLNEGIHGNNDREKLDGILYKNCIGSYLHGPLLAKNPQLADAILERMLVHHIDANHQIEESLERLLPLEALDDGLEMQAHTFMLKRLGVGL